MSNPSPGIYAAVSLEEYLSWPYPSGSAIVAGRRSMADMHEALTEPKPSTPTMRFGSFAHAGKLEPLALLNRYIVMPAFELDPENLTKSGKVPTQPKGTDFYKQKVAEFREANDTKEIVSDADYQQMLGIVGALSQNERARSCMGGEGLPEVSIVWDHEGMLLKSRLDWVNKSQRCIPDLKITGDVLRFPTVIEKFGYHIKAAMHQDGWLSLTGKTFDCWLVAVNKTPRHVVLAAPLSETALTIGRDIYQRVLAEYASCRRTNEWPDIEDPEEWTLPAYAIPEDEALGLVIEETTA